jgi:hypothetical protein
MSQRPPLGGHHPTLGQQRKKGLGSLEVAMHQLLNR